MPPLNKNSGVSWCPAYIFQKSKDISYGSTPVVLAKLRYILDTARNGKDLLTCEKSAWTRLRSALFIAILPVLFWRVPLLAAIAVWRFYGRIDFGARSNLLLWKVFARVRSTYLLRNPIQSFVTRLRPILCQLPLRKLGSMSTDQYRQTFQHWSQNPITIKRSTRSSPSCTNYSPFASRCGLYTALNCKIS